MTEPEQIVSKISRWTGKTKGGKIRKFGNGSNNSKTKPKTYQRLLVEQAAAVGFYNGVRIGKRK